MAPSDEYDIVRLLAEKEDFVRRITERDERNTSLSKQLSSAQQKAAAASEALVAEQAERKLSDRLSAKHAKALEQRLEETEARIAQLEGAAHRSDERMSALTKAHSEAVGQRDEVRSQLEASRVDATRAEATCDELRAELARRELADEKRAEVEAQRARALQQQLAAAVARAESAYDQSTRERSERDITQQRLVEVEKQLEEACARHRRDEDRVTTTTELLEAERRAAKHDVQDAVAQWHHEKRHAESLVRELEGVRMDLGACRKLLEMADLERSGWASLHQQLRHAQRERARMEKELHAAMGTARAYARHCRCAAPLVIAEIARVPHAASDFRWTEESESMTTQEEAPDARGYKKEEEEEEKEENGEEENGEEEEEEEDEEGAVRGMYVEGIAQGTSFPMQMDRPRRSLGVLKSPGTPVNVGDEGKARTCDARWHWHAATDAQTTTRGDQEHSLSFPSPSHAPSIPLAEGGRSERVRGAYAEVLGHLNRGWGGSPSRTDDHILPWAVRYSVLGTVRGRRSPMRSPRRAEW